MPLMADKWTNFLRLVREKEKSMGRGRKALRRKWSNLKKVFHEFSHTINDEEIKRILGKGKDELDPEENDLKAIIAYAIGRGLVEEEVLRNALQKDIMDAPFAFLAQLSGKSFGENIAPFMCKYWLCEEEDEWEKEDTKGYYDAIWRPKEKKEGIRLEIKASSEAPAYRFQQIRPPKASGGENFDYDALLCLGVSSNKLEFWVIPASYVDRYIQNGIFLPQHGGRKKGLHSNTYWVVLKESIREELSMFYSEAEGLRKKALDLLGIC